MAEKIMYIMGEIGNDWGDSGTMQKEILIETQSLKPKDTVTVYVDSPGGSAYAGIAIYNIFSQLENEVTFKVIGIAASAASLICCAGKVLIAKNAFMMIHNPWGYASGDSKKLTKTIEDMKEIETQYKNIYMAKTGKSEKDISEYMDSEKILNSDECLSLGLADEVYNVNAKELAAFHLNQIRASINKPQGNETKPISQENKPINNSVQLNTGGIMPEIPELQANIKMLERDVADRDKDLKAKIENINAMKSEMEDIRAELAKAISEKEVADKSAAELQAELDTMKAESEITQHRNTILEVKSFCDKLLMENKIKADEMKASDADPDKLPPLVRELVDLKVNGIKNSVTGKTYYETKLEALQARKPVVSEGLFSGKEINAYSGKDDLSEVDAILEQINPKGAK